MAKPAPQKSSKKSSTPTITVIDPAIKRKGVHAKRGTSRLKSSKNYKKAYRGQGRSR